jgi:hypothetical protein
MTKAQKKIDARITKAYASSCNGVEIPMMKIPEIFKVGRAAVEAGADDEALKAKIVEFVQTIRA